MEYNHKDISMKLFQKNNLLYQGRPSRLSTAEIVELLQITFNTLGSFIDLYKEFDGINFPEGAMMFRSKFYDIPKGEWDRIEVGFFLTSDNILEYSHITEEVNPELYLLQSKHIPFADDGAGNTIWIEKYTGEIKVFYHEYPIEEGLILIAPSFEDFCASLENRRL